MNDPRILVALDYSQEQQAIELVAQLDPALCRLKVGKEMFTHFGPAFIDKLQRRGFQVFLDLKYHDIPNTVAYDLWLGPAPWAPYNRQRCDGNFGTSGGSWRSYIDYSGGGMTDWGAHHFGGATFAIDVQRQAG